MPDRDPDDSEVDDDPQQPRIGPQPRQGRTQDDDGPPGGYLAELGRPPGKSRGPWIVAGVAVLFVVIVVVLVVSLSGDGGDGDPGGPTNVANAVVDALNAKDSDTMSTLMCVPRIPVLLSTIKAQSDSVEIHASLKGFATVSSDSATAIITVNTAYQGKDVSQDVELSMNKKGTTWCADIFSGPANLVGG